jgi:histidyl-tRNA synthetase
LSEDSQRRLETNPLRILDSKDPRDQEACRAVPPAAESLSEKSREHFDRVQQLLSSAGVTFRVDPTLVRGFDYYTETLWEVTAGGLGAQNAVGGGGRYDNLVEELGGRATPAVGFGSGLERLLIALESQKIELPNLHRPLVWIVTQGDAAKAHAWPVAAELRSKDIAVDMDLAGRGMKGQFKLADRAEAAWCVIIGDAEVQNQTVAVKNMKTGEQIAVKQSELCAKLLALLAASV